MDYSQNLWDLSLPQQLPPIDDSDFLNLLSKQINSNTLSVNAQSNPQNLLRLPNISPPLSEDSSPSPPAQSRGLSKDNQKDSETRDEMLKRKALDFNSDDDDDELEGQPQQKSRDASKKGGSRRKSSGNPDEGRLLKRKEQNRAAQRAFRERKEKHVKDLEDKVAALEAKTSTQASENENLRDLLGRLQNENLMLKQSAFTFSFPGSGTPGNNNAAQPQRSSSLNSSPANSSNKSSSPASTSLTSARDSPTSGAVNIPSGNNSGSGFTPLLSFSSLANNSNQSANTNSTNGNPPSSTASSTSSLPLTSFFSPPPNVGIQSPYTTIASNPLYTSYTDMSSWDQLMFGDMSGNSDTTMTGSNLSGINPSSTTGSGGMEDLFNTTANYGDLIPFSGFASGNSPVGTMNPIAQSPSVSPIAHASGPMSSFSQLSSGTPHTTAHPASFSQYRSSSPCGGADPDQAPLPGSAHHQPRSNMALTSPQQGEHDTGKCPKTATDFENIIASQPLATLGGSTGPDRHMEMGEVWRKIKEHPQFEEIDIDGLCHELSQKARCDGTRLVLDSNEGKTCKDVEAALLRHKKVKDAKANGENKNKDSVPVDTDSPSSASSSSTNDAVTPKSTTSTISFGGLGGNAQSDLPVIFNPFLPLSFQQQMQNALANNKNHNADGTMTSPTNNSPLSPGMTAVDKDASTYNPFDPTNFFGNGTLGSHVGTFGSPSGLGTTDLSNLGMDSSFASMMDMSAFSPSAYLSFDE